MTLVVIVISWSGIVLTWVMNGNRRREAGQKTRWEDEPVCSFETRLPDVVVVVVLVVVVVVVIVGEFGRDSERWIGLEQDFVNFRE